MLVSYMKINGINGNRQQKPSSIFSHAVLDKEFFETSFSFAKDAKNLHLFFPT